MYLYITPGSTAGTLFATQETTRKPNLSPAFIEAFSQRLGLTFAFEAAPRPIAPPTPAESTHFSPEDVFYYAYAIFHSPTYRQRYAEFLKIDFPRLPLVGDAPLFRQLAALGYELTRLHLLQSPALNQLQTTFPIAGDNAVVRPRYVDTAERVYINDSQYFAGIDPAVWQFQIGGYQVLDKWLKDRKGRRLTFDDVLHYQRVVVALRETMRVMAEIDQLPWLVEAG